MEERRSFWLSTFYTGLQSGVKLLVNFLIGKLSAVFLGTAGVGLLGQFQSVVFFLHSFSNGGVQHGVVKYLSADQNPVRRRRILETAFAISLVCSLAGGILLYALFPVLNDRAMSGQGTRLLFAAAGGSALFNALGSLMLSVLTAARAARAVAVFNMAQAVLSLACYAPLVYWLGLHGAMLALVAFQAPSLLVLWLVYRRQFHPDLCVPKPVLHKAEGRRLAAFAAMSLLGVAGYILMQVLVRNRIIAQHGAATAGLWEGINRISNYFVYFVTLIFTVQVLPRYSAARGARALADSLRFYAARLLPLMLVVAGVVYLLRSFLVGLLFTADFLPMTDAMHWFLVSDVLKVCGWLFSYLLISQRRTATVVVIDALYHVLHVALVYAGLDSLAGVGLAYAVSNAAYALVLGTAAALFLKRQAGGK